MPVWRNASSPGTSGTVCSVNYGSGGVHHARLRSPTHQLVPKLLSGSLVLYLIWIFNGWFCKVNFLEHHDVIFDLPSMQSFSQLTVQWLALDLYVVAWTILRLISLIRLHIHLNIPNIHQLAFRVPFLLFGRFFTSSSLTRSCTVWSFSLTSRAFVVHQASWFA